MKKHLRLSIIILCFLIIIVSISYAFFASAIRKEGTATASLATKQLRLVFLDGPSIEINGILPGQKMVKTFSVTNDGNTSQLYHLLFDDVINELNRTQDLVYTLTSTNGGATKNETVFPNDNLATNVLIPANTTQTYTLTIEYKNAPVDQNADMNKLIATTIRLSIIKYSTEGTFAYTGSPEEFVASKEGYYLLEVWGGQGGSSGTLDGGYGGYTRAEVYLHKDDQLTVVVGGAGATNNNTVEYVAGGYNGGGMSFRNSNGDGDLAVRGSGGGATHIATTNRGELKNYSANRSDLLVVAGGGGGSAEWQTTFGLHTGYAGNGGGFIGGTGTVSDEGAPGEGGTQLAAGTSETVVDPAGFGYGGDSQSYTGYNNNSGGSGGGGGYFGGGASMNNAGAGGGSGYINTNVVEEAYMVCKDCTPSTETATYTKNINCASSDPTPNCSKMGNGAAKITFIKKVTFNTVTNQNDVQIASRQVTKGLTYDEIDLVDYDLPNFEFEGYYTDSQFTQPINLATVIDGDFTLYAKFSHAYKKTYTTAAIASYEIPTTGNYKIEVWGAQGGSASGDHIGGYGGYAVGYKYLTAGTTLYVGVGEAGGSSEAFEPAVAGGYNGGGTAYSNMNGDASGSVRGAGGGATHIATTNLGVLANYSSSRSDILIVAGGGGGASSWSTQGGYAGNGGGASGTNGTLVGDGAYGTGGSQTAGGNYNGSFGTGGNAIQSPGWGNSGGSGGGGGYFGGSYGKNNAGAGGGSGYINTSELTNAQMVCYNCTPVSTPASLTETTTCHKEKPTSNCAKEGHGYVKIISLDE